jgi:hypothetical protein
MNANWRIYPRQQDNEAKLDGHKEALRAVQEDQKKRPPPEGDRAR